MRTPFLVIASVWLGVATPMAPMAAQSRNARPDSVRPTTRDSLARLTAARAALAQLDTARQRTDWETAGRFLCADAQSVPSRGGPIGRDSLLALVALARLSYALVPVWEGAVLSWSPDDSTVVFDGRAQPMTLGTSRSVGAAVWVYREFRRRPEGWCQVLGRVRGG